MEARPYPDMPMAKQAPPIRAAELLPPPLASVVIAFSAIVLDPAITAPPILASEHRLYHAICAFTGLALFLWRIYLNGTNRISLPGDLAFAFLATAAPALFVVSRVQPSWIIFMLLAAILLSVTESDAARNRLNLPAWSYLVTILLFVWLVVAGLTTFQLASRFSMPVAGAAAMAGMVLISWRGDDTGVSGALLAVVALIGAELKLVLNYILLDPLASAAIWLLGVFITFAATTVMRLRASS